MNYRSLYITLIKLSTCVTITDTYCERQKVKEMGRDIKQQTTFCPKRDPMCELKPCAAHAGGGMFVFCTTGAFVQCAVGCDHQRLYS